MRYVKLKLPSRLQSDRAFWAALAALTAAGAGLLYLVDPRVPGNYPPCLFLYFTGCYCPGCGSLRALHGLLHGDPLGALDYNPLTVIALPFIIVTALIGLNQAVGRPRLPNFVIPHQLAWVLLGVIILFWVLRNIPIYPLTMLAP